MRNAIRILIGSAALVFVSGTAAARDNVSFSFSVGAPAYVAPAPSYYYPPPAVAYYPPPSVYYSPAPAYYAPPVVYYGPAWGVRFRGGGHHWHGHHR